MSRSNLLLAHRISPIISPLSLSNPDRSSPEISFFAGVSHSHINRQSGKNDVRDEDADVEGEGEQQEEREEEESHRRQDIHRLEDVR
ncbi:hypothetical protein L1987_84625 [Smallanthus sonchifolius]|uniref:Uncharacterized protein n=1 Tax=Smallanthus sonchifolius TaxID=185202 RepID=A0ACB8XUW5_9ASTR|nr:hypothetical protein L1987_84625 [Smallanthus sonchifolius]